MIDSIDHIEKTQKKIYRSWKYWHSPMLHAKALALVVAWDIYLEVTEGKLDSDCKDDSPTKFYAFVDYHFVP